MAVPKVSKNRVFGILSAVPYRSPHRRRDLPPSGYGGGEQFFFTIIYKVFKNRLGAFCNTFMNAPLCPFVLHIYVSTSRHSKIGWATLMRRCFALQLRSLQTYRSIHEER